MARLRSGRAARSDTLTQAPSAQLGGGGHALTDVEAVDVLALVPDGKSNAATDRIDGHLIRATQRALSDAR